MFNQTHDTMTTLADAERYIDSFARPSGYSTYAWKVTKKVALEVWDSYLNNRPYSRPLNYYCPEFYTMIQTPEGSPLVPGGAIRRY